jgi:aerobic C4-dicarboxylate transport protein
VQPALPEADLSCWLLRFTIHKIPVEGLAFLLGVDKFMSEARAITNLIGNSVATIVIAKSENDYLTI